MKQILVVENSSKFDTSRPDRFLTRKTMTKKALPEIHEVSELQGILDKAIRVNGFTFTVLCRQLICQTDDTIFLKV